MAQSRKLCPSARAKSPEAQIIGVIGGSPEKPRVRPVIKPFAVTQELLALSAPASPEEVFRIAAPCADVQCAHFAHDKCNLIKRIIKSLPIIEAGAPPCIIRSSCRWWTQEGTAACIKCSQIVTDSYNVGDNIFAAATTKVV